MVEPLVFSTKFVNDGGPLIVLPRELLRYWHGTGEMHNHDCSSVASDYRRACEAAHPAELLEVGPGVGLAIGAQEHVEIASWATLPETHGVYLVAWHYCDAEAHVELAELLRTDVLPWQRLPRTMEVSDGDVVLLHAASAGDEVREPSSAEGIAFIGDGVVSRLARGQYAVDIVEVGGKLDRDTFGCVICRWIFLR
ncbi:MAG TPA: Imm21 family immunity protein [Pirellulales bacterium]